MAVPMSKQVNRVNIESDILHGNWSSYWKYNELLTLLLLNCKTDIIIMQAIHNICNAGAG